MKKTQWLMCVLVVLMLGSFAGTSSGEDKEKFMTLWPGEKATYEGVHISYKAIPSETPEEDPAYVLDLEGPEHSMIGLPISPAKTREEALTEVAKKYYGGVKAPTSQRNMSFERAYLDGVFVYEERALGSRLTLRLRKQKDLSDPPSNSFREEFCVSSKSPVQFGNWLISVSSEEKAMPDGTYYVDIAFHDNETGEQQTMPAIKEGLKTLGRFTFAVMYYDFISGTAQLQVNGDPDFSIRGGDTYTKTKPPKEYLSGELKDYLAYLSKEYDFQVQWKGDSEYPDLLEAVKSQDLSGHPKWGGILKDQIARTYASGVSVGERFILEWPDPHQLIVSPSKDFKVRFIARKNAEQEWEQRKAEGTKFSRKVQQLVFSRTLIKPKLLSAKAIEPLVKKEMKRYQVVSKEQILATDTTIEEGEYLAIVARPADASDSGRTESFIVDEKQNAFIIEAMPSTIERVQAMVNEMDGILGKSSSPGPANQYRIKAILLEGLKGDAKSSADESLASDQGQIDLAKKKLELASEKNLRNAQLFKAGRITEEEMKQAELEMLEANNAYVAKTEKIKKDVTKPKNPASPEDYGISQEDLALFGFERVAQLGKGVIGLLGEKGDVGIAKVALTNAYSCRLEYLDSRAPYVIVRAGLLDRNSEAVLLENTIYLEKGKPTLLGLTNLKQALILVLKLE